MKTSKITIKTPMLISYQTQISSLDTNYILNEFKENLENFEHK